MTEWKRPPGASENPEECYRAEFQHGAQKVREMLDAPDRLNLDALVKWIEIDLQQWRHKPGADPRPPDPKRVRQV